MSEQALAAVSAITAASPEAAANISLEPVGAKSAASGAGFGDMVTQGINHVNQQLMVSQTDLQQLSVGNAQNLHQIMIRLEESRLSFQLMMQVRSRLLEAYQDVMKMQL
ncbi:MAG TPA: flagellar hook-basal body complex protein FliE [Ensifer sp.]|jgi:flagellar hook-basal body complex protein FliE|uniref:flagellar hook-basal body complex protein FliE n=1 Tax=Ensifer sp. TaxID=1872086 RepID=UPI002E0EB00D|nr:flagellar hook-basal body complex protein FliE [Ensifer sp.]